MKSIFVILATAASLAVAAPVASSSLIKECLAIYRETTKSKSTQKHPRDYSPQCKLALALAQTYGHPITDFRNLADCPAASCPTDVLDAKGVCECENAADLACYLRSNGGIAEPVPREC